MRWVTYSSAVYHAAYDDLEPLCGAHVTYQHTPVSSYFREADDKTQRHMRRASAYMCRRCQKLTDERPDWPWHREAPSNS